MTLPGSSTGALRGAVDLSSLGRPAPAPSPAASAGAPTLLQEVTDATFEEAFLATREVPALFVLWDGQADQTRGAVDAAVSAAQSYPGRLRVCAVDVRTAPKMAQAFGVQQIPVTMAIIAGQPVPLFAGVQAADQLRQICDQVLQLAAQNGVTGRFEPGTPEAEPVESPLPAAHAKAYEAIESGDYTAAVAAYEQALKENPGDADAKAGLAQVSLLCRLDGVDVAAARAAAAQNPQDVDAQLLVADLDLSGGHVEDAFARLVDLVKATSEDDRERARQHLLDLFEVVGSADERVAKARRALMSALF
ncbi:tetratricopeptide repeat protein [Austwickia chelonae]|uniref:tetratricopeptide repeat protein n=1 Tax=Austwickia chelonae TaxID=100225 RepID=UPI000E283FB9|nr:tetratricopeptide repeat protein [Austwickia chelonae]